MAMRSSEGKGKAVKKTQRIKTEESMLTTNVEKEPILTSNLAKRAKHSSKYDFNFWKKTESDAVVGAISISELNFGMCFNRPIRFRVSFKSGKRSSKNGDMFNFHIADPDGEIQVTVFPEETASFFDLIEFNRTFELTNFNVKKEDSNFPLFLGNGKYICLLGSSKIEALDDNIISELKFNFVPIDGIKNLEPNSKCDVIGIIVKNWGKEIIGDNKVKRDVTITDKSKECIILTLWGEEYDEFDSEEIPIIIHNGVVHDYNESRTITCAARTLFWRNPSNSAAEELKLWFDDEKFD
ncbi:replication protein A 70 kDa DNA-binding subunit-like [Bradysia coprophila]|uniref:replication protein A 70 kDa DNA-binding subunit-like n=1 Tax=Bradysia coprophila TaxID=38358 RepID=UPI00187DABF7|nr:replication protein A 70 kDa DNA-binding subunit-like [Bradysia coprophila]